MKRERILVTVKTYPTLSKKYTELVCIAGFREDGSWIRLYPTPFRFLKGSKQFKKYQWIELDVEENPEDQRPESYRPCNIDDIELGNGVLTSSNWEQRRNLIFAKNRIHSNLEEIIAGAKNNKFSLVIFKPKQIKDFIVKKVDREWPLSKQEAAQAALKQGSLFDETDLADFKLVRKVPYKFSYCFADDEDRESTLMITDWEIGQLYWNCLKKDNCEKTAIAKVRQKYFDEFASTKDIHFFLGTTSEWHLRAPNPYIIIGVFYPTRNMQGTLF